MPSPSRPGLPLFLSRSRGATSRHVRRRRRAGAVSRVFLALERLEGRWCPSTLYDFDVIAQTGQLGLSAMGTGPSINDGGTVAFVGDFKSGAQGLFTGDGTAAGLQNINPSFSNDPNRVFGNPVEINDLGEVLAVDRYTAADFDQFTLRTWDASAASPFQIDAIAGGANVSGSISDNAAINTDGEIAYSVLSVPGSGSSTTGTWTLEYQASPGLASTIANLKEPQDLEPVISDNGLVVARVGGTNTTADPLTGYSAGGSTATSRVFGLRRRRQGERI